MTVSCHLSVVLSAVGDGLPYDLHRTFHVLPLRPLCGADVRLTFSFQGSTPFGAPASFRSVSYTRKGLRCLCSLAFVVLIVPRGFPLVKCFFQKILNFFRSPCGSFCVAPWSISDYRITQGCKLVKYFFQKIRKKSGAKIYFISLLK